jgi:hypothetical protein
MYQFTRMAIKLTVVIIEGYHCYKIRTKLYRMFFSQGDRHCRIRHNRSTTDPIFCSRQLLEKTWEYGETVHNYS